MKIVLCGSISLCDEILKIKDGLDRMGHEAVLPESITKFLLKTPEDAKKFKSKDGDYMSIKPLYMRDHFEKIERCDAILVVNKEKNGIENYIGGNTFAEMAVAFFLRKKVFLLNPIPEDARFDFLKEEMSAMRPTVLNGDLAKIC